MCFSTIEEAHREYEYGQIPIYRDSPFQRKKSEEPKLFGGEAKPISIGFRAMIFSLLKNNKH